jgi:hypothetical protein
LQTYVEAVWEAVSQASQKRSTTDFPMGSPGCGQSPQPRQGCCSAAQCSCPFPTTTCEVPQLRFGLAVTLTLRQSADSASRQAVATAAAESCRLRAREQSGPSGGTSEGLLHPTACLIRLIWAGWTDLDLAGSDRIRAHKQAHSRAVACARHTRRLVPAHRPACQSHRQSR